MNVEDYYEGDLLESNGVKMLILKKWKNRDFIALTDNNSNPERYSSVDIRNYTKISKVPIEPLNLLKKALRV